MKEIVESCRSLLQYISGEATQRRAQESLKQAGDIIEAAKRFEIQEQFPLVIPLGRNNSGKSYFINSLSLRDNDSASNLSWESQYPVISASTGDTAVTIYSTRICPNHDEKNSDFSVKFVLSSKEDYARRELLYQNLKKEGSNYPEVPPFEATRESLLQELKNLFSNPIEASGADSDVWELKLPVSLNIFDSLTHFRKEICKFEALLRGPRANIFFPWLIGVRIQGPFTHLRKQGIELADVSFFFFFFFFF